MTSEEQTNMAVVEAVTGAATKYLAGDICAADFIKNLTVYMTDDVEFWSNYTPSWEPLRPLFARREGIDEIVARYDYENEHETITPGSGMPIDIAISGEVIYYTQTETASFFGMASVTWGMVTKLRFRDGKIARIQMFLDPDPIENVYSSGKA